MKCNLRRLASLLVLISLLPQPASAWGLEVHRFITQRALSLLPSSIRPFFAGHRSFIVEHSVGPDLWRLVGFRSEPPRHFLDLDAYGAYPFSELPRDYREAVKKFGRRKIEKNGKLPWRAAEMQAQLVKAFRKLEGGNKRYASTDIRFLAAVLAHYVADAHVPFHAVVNYDGQQTNQHGIHARFETQLFLRFRSQLSIKGLNVHPIPDVKDFMFDTLLASSALVPAVLQADLQARKGLQEYDDLYFRRFFDQTRTVLEKRLASSINAVASVIVAAWKEAGSPELSDEGKPGSRRIQR